MWWNKGHKLTFSDSCVQCCHAVCNIIGADVAGKRLDAIFSIAC